ncbi:heme A synthase [Arthrobacter sp. NPDC090010]|uniref:COX15/CtaA family protein n=1 Tax=Arthrobacter sp. NPDC090010 TaxID=3363942 RepID=UPI0037F60415
MNTRTSTNGLIGRFVQSLPTEVDSRVRGLSIASLVGQVILIGTGGAVRLTSSGLGCPTWPRCTSDSLVNTPEMGIHGIIEFGNRTLTFVLALIALLMLVALWRIRRERKDLFLLSLGLLASIPAQAIIGGITVLSQLNPWVVGLHFLVSMALVIFAMLLVNRAYGRTGHFMTRALAPLPGAAAPVTAATAFFAALAVVLGVIVTGAGPHAGDANAPRNNLDWDLVSHFHAVPAYLVTAGVLVSVVLAFRGGIRGPFRTGALILLFVTLLQATIGFIQYYNGIPALLVGSHMVVGALLMAAATNLADIGRWSPKA